MDVGASNFSGGDWDGRGVAPNRSSSADDDGWISCTCGAIRNCRATRGGGWFVRALPDPHAHSYCAGIAVHAAGAVAVQRIDTGAAFALASLQRADIRDLRIDYRCVCAGDEFRDAGDRGSEPSGSYRNFWRVLFICAGARVLDDSAA